MSKNVDKGWLDRVSEILNGPLPDTAGSASTASTDPQIPKEDDDNDTLLDRITDAARQGSAKHEARSPRIWSPPILQGPVVRVTGIGWLPYIRPVDEGQCPSGLDEIRAYCP